MILFLGTPGAGKTTQTKLLAEYLNCPWFSMGELIRQNATGQDRKDMLAGKIISDEATLGIV
jgi:adenylate kinase family enzyme